MADAMAASLALMAPDLRFVLSEREVTPELQAELSDQGFRSIGLFVSMVDTKAELRAYLQQTITGDPAENGITRDVAITRRMNAARLIDAWDACSKRQDESDRVHATQRASRLPLTMAGSQHIILRQRLENEYGRVEDAYYPCKSMVERRLEELEQGEVVAEDLTDCVSVAEAVEDVIGAVLDRDGATRPHKVTKKVSSPTNSEELRSRIKLLGISFQLASFKHSSRMWLKGMTPQVWLDHLEYILGDQIYGLKVEVMNSTIEAPWLVVMHYEHAVRKFAVRAMMFDNLSLADSMIAARKDGPTKERHFSTPVSMAASVSKQATQKRVPDEGEIPGRKNFKKLKGKGKGGKEGKGGKGGKEGKGGKGTHYPHTKTPDGRLICFRFQDGTCTSKKCNYVHVCAKCLAQHSMAECTAAA